MAVTSFIPQVWEAKLLTKYSKGAIAELITTRPTKIVGNTITFNKATDVTIKDYSGSVAWDTVNTTSVDILMNQKKYFSIQVDDVDAVQAAGELMQPHVNGAAVSLQETTDSYVLGLFTGAHADNVIGNDTTPIALTKANVYDSIVDLGTKLNKKKVPKADRFCVIDSDVLGLLSKDDRFTRSPVVLENGVVEGQKINGMQIVVSEELSQAAGKKKIMALHKEAIGFGKQIDQVEAMRLENAFADGVRGLTVYGSSVLRPEALAVLTATVA
jgi:hypothetical protein